MANDNGISKWLFQQAHYDHVKDSGDLEQGISDNHDFTNDAVRYFSWKDVNVVLEDWKTRTLSKIVDSNCGSIQAGQVLAIMGPSGCGKTTLLNALAHRSAPSKMEIRGSKMVNGRKTTSREFSQIACYVKQEDTLMGSLTVKETVDFAARLALPRSVGSTERLARVNNALDSFGLQDEADRLIGTPVRRGISGGQKKRVSVASRLVTSPKILFLDEPTSGLDSAASLEVMRYISSVAKRLNLIVILSIHQPSTATFGIPDLIMLLSRGRTCYFGSRKHLPSYFKHIDLPIPTYTNPAEFILDLVNIDFTRSKGAKRQRLNYIHHKWYISRAMRHMRHDLNELETSDSLEASSPIKVPHPRFMSIVLALLHRSWIKSYRDVFAYQLRIAMYTALAILMGTVWLRLSYDQVSIQPYINAIFFGGAFMSFMAVSYIPAYSEDLKVYREEHANGLYGPLAFLLVNLLISLPYLFLITFLFSIISYWLVNFFPTAGGFFLWMLYLFLDLVAAEGLVILITSLTSIFVVALAITAFANGLWMCVGGFLVPPSSLNVFWKYSFHYIDYQAWVTEGLMINQFSHTTYDCATRPSGGYTCMYPSELEADGKIQGSAVLKAYGYDQNGGIHGKLVAIMLGICIVYRILAYLVLLLKKS